MVRLYRKIITLPNAAKASIAFFVSNLFSKGVSYIVTPIYTRMLSADEYGQVSVFLTWVQILGILATFCLSYGVFNNGMVDYPTERDEYSFSMLIFSNVITIAFAGVLLCCYPFVKEIIRFDIVYVILMCVLFFFQPAYNFWAARQRYELKYKALMFWSILISVLSPMTAILFIIISPHSNRLFARIFGAESTLIAIYAIFYVWLGINNNFKVSTKYWKEAFMFNLPLIPHYLSTHLLGSLDRIMISDIVGDSQTAYYSVAASVAALSTIMWQAVNCSLIPYTYEKCKEKDYRSIDKITYPILMIFAISLVFIIMFAPEIIRIMATEEYMEAIYVVPPIVSAVFFQALYHVFGNIVYYYKKPIYVMIGSVTAIFSNVVLNYFCINKFGYLAAGYTTLASFIIQAAIDYRAIKITVGNSVYNSKHIVIISIFVIGASILSNVFYCIALVRYSIIIIMLLTAFIMRKKIQQVVRCVG